MRNIRLTTENENKITMSLISGKGNNYRDIAKMQHALSVGLKFLTDKQRQAFMMYHCEKRTLQEIADEQGVNKATVYRTIQRAKRKLGKLLPEGEK